MPAVSSSFALGIATPTPGVLTLNGATVAQHSNGAFLAFVPVMPGNFTFHFEYAAGTTTAVLDRRVKIARPPTPLPAEPLAVDPDFTRPDGDAALRPGDWLVPEVKGTPGVRAEFKVAGATAWLPMVEDADTPGLYRGALAVDQGFRAERAAVRFRLQRGFWSSAKVEARGTVTAPAEPRVVEVSTEPASIRAGAGRGFMLFPPMGARFVTDGRLGTQVRLRLSADHAGWIGADSVRLLPPGTPPPEAVLGTVRTLAPSPREVWVEMALTETVAGAVEQDGEWTHVRLYNTVGHMNWAIHSSSAAFVRELRWVQEDSRTVRVSVRRDAAVPLWGWRLQPGPDQTTLVLRLPPPLEPYGPRPLHGLTIVLDPGHSPRVSEGRVGPAGTWESTLDMAIALELKTLLEGDGATVHMTREGDGETALQERPRIAWEKRADLFVSLHLDALPDGADPFESPRGFKVIYYHPHSLPFGRALHRAFQRLSPLPDEGLWYGNLLVAREPGMPALLTESDYYMFPDREEKLATPAYQKEIARIHREGILDYLRSLVKPPPPPPPPPPAGPPTPAPKPKGRPPDPEVLKRLRKK